MPAEVGDAQRIGLGDELAEHPLALGEVAHAGAGLLVDADVDEGGQPTALAQHAQRAVAGVDQRDRRPPRSAGAWRRDPGPWRRSGRRRGGAGPAPGSAPRRPAAPAPRRAVRSAASRTGPNSGARPPTSPVVLCACPRHPRFRASHGPPTSGSDAVRGACGDDPVSGPAAPRRPPTRTSRRRSLRHPPPPHQSQLHGDVAAIGRGRAAGEAQLSRAATSSRIAHQPGGPDDGHAPPRPRAGVVGVHLEGDHGAADARTRPRCPAAPGSSRGRPGPRRGRAGSPAGRRR